MNAYLVFVQEKRPGELLANPTMDHRAIVAHIGKLWAALSELEKTPFVAGALRDKQRIEKSKAVWCDHPPKLPLNACVYFEVEQRSNVIKANPGMKFGAVTQQLAALWRGASDTQKAPYIERARRDSIRYNDDMARWKQQAKYARKPATRGRSGRPPTKKPKNTAPRKPASSFIYYVKDHRARVRKEHPKWTQGEISKELGRQWREDLSAEDKAPYAQQALDARLVYIAYTEEQTQVSVEKRQQPLPQLQPNPQHRHGIQMVGYPAFVRMPPAAGQPGLANDHPNAGQHVYQSDISHAAAAESLVQLHTHSRAGRDLATLSE